MALFEWFRKRKSSRVEQETTKQEESEEVQKERQERLQKNLQTWKESRSQREEWVRIARDLQTSSDTLRRIVAEYEQGELRSIRHLDIRDWEIFYKMLPDDIPYHWEQEFYRSVCANPNLPIQLFLEELPITKASVAGLFENPVSSLFLLERPDFIESLRYPRERGFVLEAVEQTNAPSCFLSVLANFPDRWIAFEAQTHVGYEPIPPASGTDTPDLNWLDQQILELIRVEEFPLRCKLYELAWHGLIQGGIATQLENPWNDENPQDRLREVNLRSIRQCIREAKIATYLGRVAQEIWGFRWLGTIGSHDGPSGQVLAFHPETPFWAVRHIAKQNDGLLTLAALQHPNVPPEFIAERRGEANFRAIEYATGTSSPAYLCVFYLVVRDAPEDCLEWASNPRAYTRWSLPHAHFLMRLGVALRANDANPDQKELRTLLLDDPNRYVRAAARREIVWPESNK